MQTKLLTEISYLIEIIGVTTSQFQIDDLPENGYELLLRRPSKLIIHPVLQDPHDYPNNNEESSSDTPH